MNHPAWSTPIDKQGRYSRPDQADKCGATLNGSGVSPQAALGWSARAAISGSRSMTVR